MVWGDHLSRTTCAHHIIANVTQGFALVRFTLGYMLPPAFAGSKLKRPFRVKIWVMTRAQAPGSAPPQKRVLEGRRINAWVQRPCRGANFNLDGYRGLAPPG